MALRLPPLPSVRDILRMYDLRARKQLAQNFILQPRLLQRLRRHVGPLGRRDAVLEVGPGPGGITRELVRARPGRLAVVELDKRFLPSLEALRSAAAAVDLPMDIFHADILQFNVGQLVEELGPEWRLHLVGNLPFNVSLPLLVRWMHDLAERRGAFRHGRLTAMTLTFQAEVAERLAAGVWTTARSRLSVMAQAYCSVRVVDRLAPTCFVPQPRVYVGVVRLEPLAQPLLRVPFPVAMRVVRHAFHGRQRQLLRCLETLYPPQRPDLVRQLFTEAAIFPTRRAIELSVEEVAALADVYHDQCRREPDLLEYDFRARETVRDYQLRRRIQRQVLDGRTLSAELLHDDVMRRRLGQALEPLPEAEGG